MNERLTEWTGDRWIATQKKIGGKFIGDKAVYAKLAHFEDLAEQGRLVELPCKFGDIVWAIQENRCCTCHDLDFFTIVERGLEPSMIFYFGKTIFLTKAEAQAALVKMEGQK